MPNDTRSPDEIERDIERERAQLADTVGALQDRFSPEAVIREIARGFREHGGEFGTAVTRSVKQNPVALALTGAGLAWLMFGRSHDTPSYEHRLRSDHDFRDRDDDRHRPTRARSVYGDSEVGMPIGGAYAERGYAAQRRNAADRRYSSYPDWARHDLDDDPLAHDDDADGRSLGERAGDAASSARDAVAQASGGVAAGAKSVAGAVSSGASSVGSGIASGASTVGAGVSRAANRTADRATRARARLARGTEDLSEAARERVVNARARAVELASRADNAARRNYARGRDAAQDFVEEQPLIAGAFAMAVGAAIASALPRTRQEDDYLGEGRDRLFDEAERIFHEERLKAERVANAALDEASAIVREERDKADDAAPGEKSAVEAAADKVRDASDRIGAAAKSEADRQDLGKPKT